MKNYLLLGYNSGGYKDRIIISFDGIIQKYYKPDPEYPDTPSCLTYFKITHKDGTVTEENRDFFKELIYKKRGYHESFLVCQIFEINPKSLFEALKNNDIDAAIDLIEAGVDVNSKDENGQTPLHIVAKEGDFFATRQLLEAKANINAKDNKLNTPLDLHIKHKNDKYYVDYLLKEGAIRKNV